MDENQIKNLEEQLNDLEKRMQDVTSKITKGIGEIQKAAQGVQSELHLIQGDMQSLDKETDDLENTKAKLHDIQKELESVDQTLVKVPKNVSMLQDKWKLLSDEVTVTKELLERLEEEGKKAKEALDGSEESAKAYRATQREIINTRAELETLEKKAEEAKNEAFSSSTLKGQLKELASHFKNIGEVGEKVGNKIGTAFQKIKEKVGGVASKLSSFTVSSVKEGISYNAKKQSEEAPEGEGGSFEEQTAAFQENLETIKGEILGSLTGDLFAALDSELLPKANEWLSTFVSDLSSEGLPEAVSQPCE